ncbi:MAG: phage head closure protein [Beijerinckiaceae bacterium]
MIVAGKLKYRIQIWRNSAGAIDQYGVPAEGWALWRTVHAELLDRQIKETNEPSGTVTRETITWRVRYRAGVTAADRIRFGGQDYEITSVLEIGRREALEITCHART